MTTMESYVHTRIKRGDNEQDVFKSATLNARYPSEVKMVQLWIEQAARPSSVPKELSKYPFGEMAILEASDLALQDLLWDNLK